MPRKTYPESGETPQSSKDKGMQRQTARIHSVREGRVTHSRRNPNDLSDKDRERLRDQAARLERELGTSDPEGKF